MCWRVVGRLYSSTNRTKVVPLMHNLTPLSLRHNKAPPGKWGGKELDQYLWITQSFTNFCNFVIGLRRPLQANLCVTIFTATPHKNEPAPEKKYLQKLLCSSFREIWGSVHFPERRAPLPPVASNFIPIIVRGQQHIISNYYPAANWTISLNYLQLNNESLGMGGGGGKKSPALVETRLL